LQFSGKIWARYCRWRARRLTVGDGEDASIGGGEVGHAGPARSLVALGRRLGKQLRLRVNMTCVRILQSHTAEEAMGGTLSSLMHRTSMSLRSSRDEETPEVFALKFTERAPTFESESSGVVIELLEIELGTVSKLLR
jgi:hypothetical protein